MVDGSILLDRATRLTVIVGTSKGNAVNWGGCMGKSKGEGLYNEPFK
jgi:hypothetical protein